VDWQPGATATFGNLAFSHDIVHHIGGQDDSNRNLTLRMLLLLESASLGDDAARQRVLQAILNRYLADDPSWTWRSEGKIPRFLLNDAVRFWRTMAVDFADKFHDQIGEKWALRNTKLRFSRKLIFLAAALACFSWTLHPPKKVRDEEQALGIALAHFSSYFSRPPLEIVADEILLQGVPAKAVQAIFEPYDEFLSILDNEESRKTLTELSRDVAEKSELFQQVRTTSHSFSKGLMTWLYDPKMQVSELVRDYGFF
jgi:hypothetical protein